MSNAVSSLPFKVFFANIHMEGFPVFFLQPVLKCHLFSFVSKIQDSKVSDNSFLFIPDTWKYISWGLGRNVLHWIGFFLLKFYKEPRIQAYGQRNVPALTSENRCQSICRSWHSQRWIKGVAACNILRALCKG